jgi:hypothetical protein
MIGILSSNELTFYVKLLLEKGLKLRNKMQQRSDSAKNNMHNKPN